MISLVTLVSTSPVASASGLERLPAPYSETAPRTSVVSLTMRSDTYRGVGARVRVGLNGKTVSTLQTGTAWRTVQVRLPRVVRNADEVQVFFDNDAVGQINGRRQDRNLHVKVMSVDGAALPISKMLYDQGRTWVQATDGADIQLGRGKLLSAGALRHKVGRRAPVPAQSLGVCITGTDLLWTSDADRVRQMDLLAASGARWLRVDIAGPHFTWEPGQYYFTHMDKLVALAKERNIKILGILHQLPVYARPKGTPAAHGPMTARERAAFSKFASVVAKRYAGKVSAYEIWNEPNLAAFWSPNPSAAAYATLLKQTSTVIRAADRRATIVMGGTGGAGASKRDIKAFSFLDVTLGRIPQQYYNAVAFHAYPDLTTSSPGEIGIINDYRRALLRHGAGSKALWLTETGAPTAGMRHTTPAQQARFVELAWRNMQAVANRGPVFVFMLRDRNLDGAEHSFGVVTAKGSPKPAYRSVQAISEGWVA